MGGLDDHTTLATNFRPFLKWLLRDDLVDAIGPDAPTREHRIVPMLRGQGRGGGGGGLLQRSVPAGDAAISSWP